MTPRDENTAAGAIPRRLFIRNGGFLFEPRLRRILTLAGHSLHLGTPRAGDGVAVWGRSPTAHRGEALAARHGLPLVRIEDAFLRSIRPGRAGDAPLGLLIDPVGVHFDAAAPSRLETILARDPLDDSNLLSRARDGMARLIASDLSKYNIHRADLPLPAPGYVLVVDQTAQDASIRHGGATAATFHEMLATAMADHPAARIVIRTHPETAMGLRRGHFGPADATGRVTFLSDPVSPWRLLEGAVAVYAVTSQLGFEAVLAGHRPRIFGQPFYAGWGLTDDVQPHPRRRRSLTRAQLFAAAMILAPTWYDPCRDRLCSFEEAVDQLEAEARAYREDRAGHVALGMRLWKRRRLAAVFGGGRGIVFDDRPASAVARARRDGRGLLVWAGKEPDGLPSDLTVRRVEDGFLRSRGLGAELVPPLSLVTDDRGIYYDPTRDSALEALVMAPLPPGGRARAERLVARIVRSGVTKYNLTGPLPDLPQGHRILVPGQVEDDASILLGTSTVRTNLALLEAARAAHPQAVIVFKPHPDVEAGLRAGAVPETALAGLADVVVHGASAAALVAACDEVWTMTSLMGFEALLRGKRVTCLGAPFYAGWGLTQDLGDVPARRRRGPDGSLRQVDILHLAHAALIGYPRYFDPVTHRPCPPEVVAERLETGTIPHPGPANRLLSKLQGLLAGHSWLWRR